MLTVVDNVGGVTIEGVKKGLTALTIDTHYTVAEDKVTLKKTYLETLSEGEHIFTIETSKGNADAVITIDDTTNVYLDPDNGIFDLYSDGANYDNVEVEIKHNTEGVTLTAIKNDNNTLALSTHYTVEGLKVTLLIAYLETLTEGDVTLVFETSKGNLDFALTIEDTETEEG